LTLPLTSRVPATPCPLCGYLLDACSNFVDAVPPAAGDLSVCGRCAALLVFADDLSTRLLRDGEFLALEADLRRQLTANQRMVRAVQGTWTPAET
jgi:hypothetical protein